ncbi:cytochrome c oxidase subunit 3 [Peredibacter starrii]|uniref:Cytochrome c oxidase subunit 3 n=1 Tax=Peredibacter starrii TaxID=28202 RepID=A0AAX4HS15_9BACT|nr:cytochrome c oxidase subunit 3 [Peredibacter starrii]WPU66062.1 cytochrome c oxidase subunit 3 [Peredibacter starrii]
MKNHMGMWIFLASEMMIFGVLIFLYQVAMNQNLNEFRMASHDLHFIHGTVNTVILLTSSYFVALSDVKKNRLFLILAMILGVVFISIKGFEYYDLTQEGKFPLNFKDLSSAETLFFTYYGFLTFLHLLHVSVGILLLGAAWFLYYNPKEKNLPHNAGLYWHFVDLVWVFIYPLFYLIGRNYGK